MGKAGTKPKNRKLKAKQRKQAAAKAAPFDPSPAGLQRLVDKALALQKMNQLEKAEALYKQVLGVEPNYFDALHLLGLIHSQRGEYDQALELLEKAHVLQPQEGKFYCNYGTVLCSAGRPEEALAMQKKAQALDPNHPEVYFNMGNALADLNRPEEAMEYFEKTLQMRPDHPEVYFAAGNALHSLGKYDEAMGCFNQAVLKNPSDTRPLYNLSMSFLLKGKLKEGFQNYELRWLQKDFPNPPKVIADKPFWTGESLEGKTIFLLREQGFGDFIQFCRYIPQVKARGNPRIITSVQSALKELMEGVEGIDVIADSLEDLPDFDVHSSLLSLPRLFETDLESVPAEVPYLQVPEEYRKKWEERFASDELKVGLVWAGNPEHKNDMNRSVPLEDLAAIFTVPGVQFFGLQKGAGEEELKAFDVPENFTHLGEEIEDFCDTAAILQQLDLLISVDTAPVHLAGALGRPVWILLPFVPDWRWMLEREDSPWYPSMRLFRQQQRKDWGPVIAKVKAELEKLVTGN